MSYTSKFYRRLRQAQYEEMQRKLPEVEQIEALVEEKPKKRKYVKRKTTNETNTD